VVSKLPSLRLMHSMSACLAAISQSYLPSSSTSRATLCASWVSDIATQSSRTKQPIFTPTDFGAKNLGPIWDRFNWKQAV